MSRKDAFHRMLRATSQFQHNISLILEAKAAEAARSSQWICGHLSGTHYDNHGDQLKASLDINDQLIEVIESMTKMEQALARHMQIILAGKEEEGGGGDQGQGDLGGMFSIGGDDSK